MIPTSPSGTVGTGDHLSIGGAGIEGDLYRDICTEGQSMDPCRRRSKFSLNTSPDRLTGFYGYLRTKQSTVCVLAMSFTGLGAFRCRFTRNGAFGRSGTALCSRQSGNPHLGRDSGRSGFRRSVGESAIDRPLPLRIPGHGRSGSVRAVGLLRIGGHHGWLEFQ